jgi:Fe2+ or Zn2+ uptake regulation protein
MKSDLFLAENEDLRLSSLYLGCEILKLFNKYDRITIYDLYGALQRKYPAINHANLMNALTFLYISGLLQFKKPYLEAIKQ